MNCSNLADTQLSSDSIEKCIDVIKNRQGTDLFTDFERKRCKDQVEIIKFYSWLEVNCQDVNVLSIVGILCINSLPINKVMYDKIKPWIDRYEQEKLTK